MINKYAYDGGYETEPLPMFKKKAKQIIKDFCLYPEISVELIKKVEDAEDEREVSRILKEARDYI